MDGIQVSESPGLLCLSILGRSFPTVVFVFVLLRWLMRAESPHRMLLLPVDETLG